jgi:hypothetical protein
MIITLKPHARIIGTSAECWQLRVDWVRAGAAGLGATARTVCQAASLAAAFQQALVAGLAQPGKILDLSGFNALVRDAARRFEDVGEEAIMLGEGYFVRRIFIPGEEHARRWGLTRDTGRGQKHAVQCGEGKTLAAVLAAAAWRHGLGKRQTMGIEAVGAYVAAIAHRLFDGAAVRKAMVLT